MGLHIVLHCSSTLDIKGFSRVSSAASQIGLNEARLMHSTRSPGSAVNISIIANLMFSRCGRCAGSCMPFSGSTMVGLRKNDKNFLMPIWFEHKLADTLVCGRGQGLLVPGRSRACMG